MVPDYQLQSEAQRHPDPSPSTLPHAHNVLFKFIESYGPLVIVVMFQTNQSLNVIGL